MWSEKGFKEISLNQCCFSFLSVEFHKLFYLVYEVVDGHLPFEIEQWWLWTMNSIVDNALC